MVRDIQERLAMFGADVEVFKVALTMRQVKTMKLPPNPAKVTDPRAAAYIKEHGNKSWELDALHPRDLQGLARAAIKPLVNQRVLKQLLAEEERHREVLQRALDGALNA